MMRRLPIFLVIDVSESMAGSPIENVRIGINNLTDALMSDPYAMETAYLSVITFAGKARVSTPLTYLLNFIPPELSIGAGTSLSEALITLMAEIDKNVKKNTAECKGDWRPLIFLLTDGAPNDNYQQMVKQWHHKYDGKVSVVAILMGTDSDASALTSLTENVLIFKDTSSDAYKALFKWVSTSIQTSSKEIGETGNQILSDKLTKNMDKDFLSANIPTKNTVEYFVIPTKCVNSKELYIIRIVKRTVDRNYCFNGAYKVDESYFAMSANDSKFSSISTAEIQGKNPSCPYCGNKDIGQSGCGKCHCLRNANSRSVKCPWCGDVANYEVMELSIKGGRD